MKRNIYVLAALISVLFLACAHDVEKKQAENYTPPVLKEQPKFFYPRLAQEKSINGKTKVVIKIAKEGNVFGVVVIRSAGDEILDKSVVEYCKALTFKPATLNGEPIESRYVWDFNFDFVDQKYNIRKYLDEIGNLTELANRAVAKERMAILRDILKLHNEFVLNTSDALNFNSVIEKVISKDLVAQWKGDWDSYPLSFLIYHDFIQRFPDYDSLANVKLFLHNSLKNDLGYLANVKTSDMRSNIQKERLIEKIKKFISEKYPDFARYREDVMIVGI